MFTRWDPDNAKPQCRRCNRFHGGQPKSFKARMGKELSEKMEQDAQKVVKYSNDELLEMLELYKQINKCLKT